MAVRICAETFIRAAVITPVTRRAKAGQDGSAVQESVFTIGRTGVE